MAPRISYVDPATIKDQAMLAELDRCRREGTPRPESQAIRAHVPATFWSFANTWQDVFRNGVADHNIKELCRIYTDGRDFNANDNVPSYNGYSIGKWIDTDGDGKFDVLDVETRNFKGTRLYDQTGIPLHHDNQSIIHERMYIDKSNADTLVNEITVTDNALTRPWKVVKNYRREKNAEWYEDLCSENNNHVVIGKENYFMSADGYLMPAKKDQQPPDLRYFKKAGN